MAATAERNRSHRDLLESVLALRHTHRAFHLWPAFGQSVSPRRRAPIAQRVDCTTIFAPEEERHCASFDSTSISDAQQAGRSPLRSWR